MPKTNHIKVFWIWKQLSFVWLIIRLNLISTIYCMWNILAMCLQSDSDEFWWSGAAVVVTVVNDWDWFESKHLDVILLFPVWSQCVRNNSIFNVMWEKLFAYLRNVHIYLYPYINLYIYVRVCVTPTSTIDQRFLNFS